MLFFKKMFKKVMKGMIHNYESFIIINDMEHDF